MPQVSPETLGVHVGDRSVAVHTPSHKITRATESSSSEFSLAKAIALQTEFLEAFSQDVFQQQLRALTLEHDRRSANFKKARYELAMTVQQRILPKYGFEGNLAGVIKMIHDFAPYNDVEEFKELWVQNDLLLGIDQILSGPEQSKKKNIAMASFVEWHMRKTSSKTKPACGADCESTTQDAFSKAPVSWRRGASAFADMLNNMQSSNVCGRPIMAKLSTLLIGEPIENIYDTFGFSISEFVYHMVQNLYMPSDQQTTTALGNLLCKLEKRAAVATKHLDPAYDWTSNPDVLNAETLRLLAAVTSGGHRFNTADVGNRHILFIALPLSLYVSHNPHLYELLKRMRSVSQYLRNEFSAQEALDRSSRPYSALAYAIMAALQMLHAEATKEYGRPYGDVLRALRPLQGQSSDMDHAASSLESVPGEHTTLMFRGIWVPSTINEAAATHQWSFNSFSRCLEGVCHVLNFYAGIEGSDTWELATQECHVLLMVARRGQALEHVSSRDWAFPVEFFNGLCGELEQELLVPPFAAYTFEPDCEISGSMPLEEQLSRIQKIETRWNMKLGSLLAGSPLLRDLLDGYAEPLRHILDEDCWTPKVTVRFIKCIDIADPIKELFERSTCFLWDFPDNLDEVSFSKTHDLPRRSAYDQWLEGTECIAMRQAEYETRRAECWMTNKDELLNWEGVPLELRADYERWVRRPEIEAES